MDQTRNQQNPDKDRKGQDQGVGNERRDDQNIGQERGRNQGADRDLNEANRKPGQGGSQGDRSSGSGGSQTNR